MEELELKIMSTTFFVKVSNCVVPSWKKTIQEWFSYIEREWSRFNKGNELAQINTLGIGKKTNISPLLLDILKIAEQYRVKTKGLFTPYLKKQMELNGYTFSFPFQASQAMENGQWESPVTEKPFAIDMDENSIVRESNGEVDLGGIAKGYAVETAAQWLKTIGQATFGIVDGGGDITVWSDGRKTWRMGIAHPYEEGKEIGQFSLQNGSIATSNIVYRSWKQGEQQKHHILNGKSGLPVESNLIQVTVVASNCLDAEVAAKLTFMTNETNRQTFLKKICHDLQYVMVKSNGEIIRGAYGHE